MPERQAQEQLYQLTGGLHTESSELQKPIGTTVEEENFVILKSGARRRRKGLVLEASGTTFVFTGAPASDDVCVTYRWRNVDNDPNKDWIVVQIANKLFFYDDEDSPLSGNKQTFTIDLDVHNTATPGDVSIFPVSMTSGRGKLFVTGKRVHPFHVEWDGAQSPPLTAVPTIIRERDFEGVDDQVPNELHPTTLDANHEYNLRNAGWTNANLEAYNTSESEYPAKNQVPWLAFRRATATGYADEDGTKEFHAPKLAAEEFRSVRAPIGAFLRDPFNTTESGGGSGGQKQIVSWTFVDNGSDWDITITTDIVHGMLDTDNVIISGQKSKYNSSAEGGSIEVFSFNGTHDITAVPSTTTLTFNVPEPASWVSWIDQFWRLGSALKETIIIDSADAYETDERFEVNVFFAGRIFYAGVRHGKLGHKIFFTQILQGDEEIGQCYQKQDPTDENFNSLLPNDGGVIIVNEMGMVRDMKSIGPRLFIYTTNGIWILEGGQSGFFEAGAFSISQLSSATCTSLFGAVEVEGTHIFTGDEGIHAISVDDQGRPQTVNIIKDVILSEWTAIEKIQQERVQLHYDTAQRRLYVLFSLTDADSNNFSYDTALVLSTQFNAWYKLKFPLSVASGEYITGAVALREGSSDEAMLKFFVIDNARADLLICDMDGALYLDWDGSEQIPFMTTSPDNPILTDVGGNQPANFELKRMGALITTYMLRTETGFVDVGGGVLDPVNPSSLTMQGRWDWADHTNSGKWGTAQQIYRHKREFLAEDENDTFDDGELVIVSRSRIRGRGRTLQLRFLGAAGKDAHLLGYGKRYNLRGKM